VRPQGVDEQWYPRLPLSPGTPVISVPFSTRGDPVLSLSIVMRLYPRMQPCAYCSAPAHVLGWPAGKKSDSNKSYVHSDRELQPYCPLGSDQAFTVFAVLQDATHLLLPAQPAKDNIGPPHGPLDRGWWISSHEPRGRGIAAGAVLQRRQILNEGAVVRRGVTVSDAGGGHVPRSNAFRASL
jgi:hypothetical protein